MAKSLAVASDAEAGTGFLATARVALKQFGVVGTIGRFILLRDELRRFVKRGSDASHQERRRMLLQRFDRVHKNVVCAHSPLQFFIMAEHLLGLEIPGELVICGVFKGGSAAKLSILAQLLGRRLFVCDSFAGLPACAENSRRHVSFGDQQDYVFAAGEYAGSLEEVQQNVRDFGAYEVCTFVRGWFADTLPHLDVRPAFVFTDVDYVASARDCLRSLWPRLRPGGIWFTHEAMFLSYLEGIMDPVWWQQVLGEPPPLVIGGGTGLSPAAPSLAYFRKAPS